ncbi:MAG TPA: hypothetical protein ENI12_02925 [Nitrospirae bacterium]|nr:hypothetical protein [Nitrospirota bacterium]
MRKFINIAVGILCFITLYCGISHAASTGITDSSHDLTSDSDVANFKYKTRQTCVFCHTPHGANSDVRSDTYWDEPTAFYNVGTGGPLLLWNRSIVNSDTTGYELYASSTSVAVTQVRVYSLLCLGCHDGVGALNVVQNFPGDGVDRSPPDGAIDWYDRFAPSPPDQIGDVATSPDYRINIGERNPGGAQKFVELRNDHPISVLYTDARFQDETGMVQPTTSGGVTYVGDPNLKLFSGYVECTTCHDPHNQGEAGTGYKYPFLWVDNAGSALCLNCHIK